MVEIQKADGVVRKVFIILMLTVIPVAIIVRLWMVIVEYWQLLLSVFLMGSGVIFVYFYFKPYNLKVIVSKIKLFLQNNAGVEEALLTEVEDKVTDEEHKHFLYIGSVTISMGIYFLVQFFRGR